jgi:hypothetical protein
LAFVPKGTWRPSGWEGGGIGHGRCGALPHGFVTPVMGWKIGRKVEMAKADRRDPHVSGTCGGM